MTAGNRAGTSAVRDVHAEERQAESAEELVEAAGRARRVAAEIGDDENLHHTMEIRRDAARIAARFGPPGEEEAVRANAAMKPVLADLADSHAEAHTALLSIRSLPGRLEAKAKRVAETWADAEAVAGFDETVARGGLADIDEGQVERVCAAKRRLARAELFAAMKAGFPKLGRHLDPVEYGLV